jgi:hypothetical protein
VLADHLRDVGVFLVKPGLNLRVCHAVSVLQATDNVAARDAFCGRSSDIHKSAADRRAGSRVRFPTTRPCPYVSGPEQLADVAHQGCHDDAALAGVFFFDLTFRGA